MPVYLRVGESGEHEIGRLDRPEDLPALLREAADHAEQTGFQNQSKET